MAKKGAEGAIGVDTDTDRYPTINDVFTGILRDPDVPEIGIMHLEVHTFANGEATWRCWVRGEDDARGGFLTSAES